MNQPTAFDINNTMSKQQEQSNSNPINQSDANSPSSNQSNQRSGKGRWTPEECELFEKLLKTEGEDWKRISKMIQTRTYSQVRSHAQKYFNRKNKESEKIGHNEKNIIGNKEDSTLTRAKKKLKGDTSGQMNEISESNRSIKLKQEIPQKKKASKSSKKEQKHQMEIEPPNKQDNSQQNIIIQHSPNQIFQQERNQQRLETSSQKINFKPRRKTLFKRVHSVRSITSNCPSSNDNWTQNPLSRLIQASPPTQSFFQAMVLPTFQSVGLNKPKDFDIFKITSKSAELQKKDKM